MCGDSDGNGIEGLWVSIYLSETQVLCGHVETNSEGEYKGKPVPLGFDYVASSDGREYKSNRVYFKALKTDNSVVKVRDIVLEKR